MFLICLEQKMHQKCWQKTDHLNVNVNLMEENVIQINGRIVIKVNATVENIIHVKKSIFGILLHVLPKMLHI